VKPYYGNEPIWMTYREGDQKFTVEIKKRSLSCIHLGTGRR
jgi:hypothetical protein